MKRCIYTLALLLATALSCAAQQSLSSHYTIQKLDYPNSTSSYPLGINNSREIVGTWYDASGYPHGFLWKAGKFTLVDYPGSIASSTAGINDRGDIVGLFFDEYGFLHGYTLSRPAGCGDDETSGDCKPAFKQLDVPGAAQTVGIVFEFGTGLGTGSIGINNFGELSGLYATQSEYSNGFLQIGGYTEVIDNPKASHSPGNGSKCFGVSNLSVVACDYQTQENPSALQKTHGFLRIGKLNIPLDYPGGGQLFGTQVTGVNVFGEAVGVFDVQGRFNAMLWIDGSFFTVNFPNMPYNELHSINDHGDLTGAYATTADGEILYGYVAFPK